MAPASSPSSKHSDDYGVIQTTGLVIGIFMGLLISAVYMMVTFLCIATLPHPYCAWVRSGAMVVGVVTSWAIFRGIRILMLAGRANNCIINDDDADDEKSLWWHYVAGVASGANFSVALFVALSGPSTYAQLVILIAFSALYGVITFYLFMADEGISSEDEKKTPERKDLYELLIV